MRCCKAMSLKCVACAAGKTPEQYCRSNPDSRFCALKPPPPKPNAAKMCGKNMVWAEERKKCIKGEQWKEQADCADERDEWVAHVQRCVRRCEKNMVWRPEQNGCVRGPLWKPKSDCEEGERWSMREQACVSRCSKHKMYDREKKSCIPGPLWRDRGKCPKIAGTQWNREQQRCVFRQRVCKAGHCKHGFQRPVPKKNPQPLPPSTPPGVTTQALADEEEDTDEEEEDADEEEEDRPWTQREKAIAVLALAVVCFAVATRRRTT